MLSLPRAAFNINTAYVPSHLINQHALSIHKRQTHSCYLEDLEDNWSHSSPPSSPSASNNPAFFPSLPHPSLNGASNFRELVGRVGVGSSSRKSTSCTVSNASSTCSYTTSFLFSSSPTPVCNLVVYVRGVCVDFWCQRSKRTSHSVWIHVFVW